MADEPIPLVVYLILMVVVIFIGIGIAGQGSTDLTANQKKLAKLFEHEIIHPIEGPAQEFVEVECSFNTGIPTITKVTLKGMSFDYIGKEKGVEFVILLDMIERLVLGEYSDGTETRNKITCKLNQDSQMKCDPPRNYEFDVSGISQELRIRDYFHFTIWRSQVLTPFTAGTNTFKNFKNLLDDYSPFYLASFGIGGFTTTQKCNEYSCKQITDQSQCRTEPNCYWKSEIFGIFGTCKGCPDPSSKCSAFEKDACEHCTVATQCKWFESSCRLKDWADAEERCRTCKTTAGGCDKNKCHGLSTPSGTTTQPVYYNCYYKTSNKECHVCPDGATCEMFDEADCIAESRQCGLTDCEVREHNCVKKIVST